MKIHNKLIIFLLSSSIAMNASTQDLDFDESFLDSLPDALKDEVESVEGLSANKKELEKIYRMDASKESNKRMLKLINDQLDILQNRIESDGELFENDLLKPFGNDLFTSMQTSYAPINIPNPGANYILDIGDEFEIQYIGSNSSEFSALVERDGAIDLEDVGSLVIAGKSLADAEADIKNYVASKLIGTEVFITLTRLRDIRVISIGHVGNQGMYTLPGGSSILHAINMAGGITQNGSYRNISIFRNNQKFHSIDLYDLLLNGTIDSTPLQSGDIIKVESLGPTVAISGGVSNPAIYELSGDMTLTSLLEMADITPGASSSATIRRMLPESQYFDLDITEKNNFLLNPYDQIFLPFQTPELLSVKSVKLSGFIKNPGTYSFVEGEKISDIIVRAGGYRDMAYPLGGILLRESAKLQEKEINSLRSQELIQNISASLGKSGTPGMISAKPNVSLVTLLLSEIQKRKITGRIVAEFNLSELNKSPEKNLYLQDKDEIIIPPISEYIYIQGMVNTAGAFSFVPSYSLADYLNMTGGIKNNADADQIIIVQPNGITSLVKRGFLGRYDHERILPGALIFVPEDPGALEGIQLASFVAPIASSLAISLASLNSINN